MITFREPGDKLLRAIALAKQNLNARNPRARAVLDSSRTIASAVNEDAYTAVFYPNGQRVGSVLRREFSHKELNETSEERISRDVEAWAQEVSVKLAAADQ